MSEIDMLLLEISLTYPNSIELVFALNPGLQMTENLKKFRIFLQIRVLNEILAKMLLKLKKFNF